MFLCRLACFSDRLSSIERSGCKRAKLGVAGTCGGKVDILAGVEGKAEVRRKRDEIEGTPVEDNRTAETLERFALSIPTLFETDLSCVREPEFSR